MVHIWNFETNWNIITSISWHWCPRNALRTEPWSKRNIFTLTSDIVLLSILYQLNYMYEANRNILTSTSWHQFQGNHLTINHEASRNIIILTTWCPFPVNAIPIEPWSKSKHHHLNILQTDFLATFYQLNYEENRNIIMLKRLATLLLLVPDKLNY